MYLYHMCFSVVMCWCVGTIGIWRTGLAGGLAGCCFWGFVFPFDSVKSRIQVLLLSFVLHNAILFSTRGHCASQTKASILLVLESTCTHVVLYLKVPVYCFIFESTLVYS